MTSLRGDYITLERDHAALYAHAKRVFGQGQWSGGVPVSGEDMPMPANALGRKPQSARDIERNSRCERKDSVEHAALTYPRWKRDCARHALAQTAGASRNDNLLAKEIKQ